MRLTASVAVIFLMWSGPAAHTRQVQAAHVPQPVRERLSVLVPAPPPAGATALGQPAFYNSSTLYEYMDGGADAFQGSDVQALFHRRFRTGQVEVVVDIFDMGTLENAFGTYSAERSPKREYLTMGAEGYRGKGSLNFVQARYYVKLLGNGEGADVAVQQFASAISGRIGSDKALPAVLALLPDTRRKPGVDPAEPARRFRCGLQGRGGIAPVEARTGERMGEKHSRRDFLVKPVRWVAAAGLLGRALPSLLAQPRTPQGGAKILTRTLGKTGLSLPIVSLGFMNADVPGLIRRAYELGIRHIDTAAFYQAGRNEEMVGAMIEELGVRDRCVIGTKVYLRGRGVSAQAPQAAGWWPAVRAARARLRAGTT